jgi:hypothetical protein
VATVKETGIQLATVAIMAITTVEVLVPVTGKAARTMAMDISTVLMEAVVITTAATTVEDTSTINMMTEVTLFWKTGPSVQQTGQLPSRRRRAAVQLAARDWGANVGGTAHLGQSQTRGRKTDRRGRGNASSSCKNILHKRAKH